MMEAGSLTHCSGSLCYGLAAVNIVFAAMTIPENVIVLIALAKLAKARVWKVPNILMASLATTDLLSGCISQSLYGYFLLKQGRNYTSSNVSGADFWLLLILNYSSYTLCGASLMLVSIMSIDRFLAIARPIMYKANKYRNRIVSAVVFSSLFCLLIPILRFISSATVPLFVYTVSGVIVLSLAATFISYIAVIYMFVNLGHRSSLSISRSKADIVQEGETTRISVSVADPTASCREKRLTKSFAMIAVTLVVMYLPQLIIKPLMLNAPEGFESFPVSLEDIANTLLYCNSFANPLIYAFRHKGIRKEINAMFRVFSKRNCERKVPAYCSEKKRSSDTCSSSGSSGAPFPIQVDKITISASPVADTHL